MLDKKKKRLEFLVFQGNKVPHKIWKQESLQVTFKLSTVHKVLVLKSLLLKYILNLKVRLYNFLFGACLQNYFPPLA